MINVSSEEKSGTVAKAIKLIVANLEKLRDQMKAKLDETDTRITRIEQKVIQLAKSIEDLENKISVTQFSPPPTPKVTESSELVELKDELDAVKKRFNTIEETLKNQINSLQLKVQELEKQKLGSVQTETKTSMTTTSPPPTSTSSPSLTPTPTPPPTSTSPPSSLISSPATQITQKPTTTPSSIAPSPPTKDTASQIPTPEKEEIPAPQESKIVSEKAEEEKESFLPPISGEMNEDQKALMEALKKLENL